MNGTATTRIVWALDVKGAGGIKTVTNENRQLRTSLLQTDATYRKVSSSAVGAAARQQRAIAQTRAAQEKASIAEARAALRVEEAQTKAATANERYGASSLQARRAALELADAQRVLATATRNVGSAAAAAAAEQAAAARKTGRLGAVGVAARRAATATSAAATRVGGTAAGLAGGIASRVGSLARGGVLGGAIGVGAAVSQAIQFDRALHNVNSIAQLSEGRLQALGKAVRGLAGQTAQAPKTLAAGLYDLVSSGFKAKQSLEILRSSAKAATAGLTDTQTSTAAVAAVLNAYHRPAKAAADVSDVLFQTVNRGVITFEQLAQNIGDVLPFASTLGVNLNQVGAAVSTMTKEGISAPETMTRIKAVMSALIKPSNDLQKAYKTLGVSSGEQLIKQKGFQGALEALVGTTNGGKDAIAKLFRNIRALGGVFALTGGNAKTARGDVAAFKDVAGATDKALSQQAKSVSYQWNQLKAQASGLAIGLGQKLFPAIHSVLGGLNELARGRGGAAAALSGVGKAVSGAASGIAAGIKGQGVVGKRIAGPTGRTEGFEQASTAQKVGQQIGSVARTVGSAAVSAGKQLLDAFKPALPFFQNILLPLFEGVGKGLLVSVVGAFKVLVPTIKVAATVLGAIGKVAAPLKGVFQGIGVVIGFLAAGPILKFLGGLGKVGVVFRALGAPVRVVTSLFSGLGRLIGRLPSILEGVGAAFLKAGKIATFLPRTIGGLYLKVVTAAGQLAIGAGKGLASMPAKFAATAYSAGKGIVSKLASFVGAVAKVGSRIVNALISPLRAVGSKVAGLTGDVASVFAKLGHAIVSAIVNAIKSAPGAVVDAVKSLVPGPIKSVVKKVPVVGGLFRRRGGRIRRYQDGGMVPILAAGGEVLVDGGTGMMIPGDPRSDSTLVMARPGAAVLTADGQARMAAGASLSTAIATQLPHFASGGRVKPYIHDAFNQGYGYGLDPTTGAGSFFGDVLKAGRIPEPHKRATRALSGRGSSGLSRVAGPVGRGVRAMLSRATSIAAKHLPYTYGGGHGAFGQGAPGFDCSGYVSAILGPGVLSSPMAVRHPLQDALAAGAGRYVTVGIRGTSGQNAHTMVRLGNSYFESGGRHGPARVGGWDGRFDLFHPRGFRRGGVVPGYRAGGLINRINTGSRTHSANASVRNALGSLDTLLAQAALSHVEAIGREIRSQIAKIQRGGTTSSEKRQIQRLRAALSLVEFAAGKRVGQMVATANRGAAQIDRIQTQTDQRARLAGVDPSSSRGLGMQYVGLEAQRFQLGLDRGSLRKALTVAKRHHDAKSVADITQQIRDTQDAIRENFVQMIENERQRVVQAAQDAVDTSQFGVDYAQGALSGLDVAQRLSGTADSPAGMREKATAIQSQLLPALYQNRTALYGQLAASQRVGDLAGVRQATLAIQQAGTDIASSMADAADLVRQAAEQAAQDVVDAATHGTSMAQLGEAHLELEQRLAGTYDTGAQQRADYINTVVVPAIQSEITALQAQLATAQAEGDTKLAMQIAEAIAGKQNDKLQAIVDATEQTADNTSQRGFGGTLGFTYGDETLTDQLIAVGNGS